MFAMLLCRKHPTHWTWAGPWDLLWQVEPEKTCQGWRITCAGTAQLCPPWSLLSTVSKARLRERLHLYHEPLNEKPSGKPAESSPQERNVCARKPLTFGASLLLQQNLTARKRFCVKHIQTVLHFIFTPVLLCVAGVLIPILWMRKLRPCKVKQFAQDNTANKRQHSDVYRSSWLPSNYVMCYFLSFTCGPAGEW